MVCISATISEAYAGYAVVTYNGSGTIINTGDIVYIKSNVEDYNSFWYATKISNSMFYISRESGGTYATYYVNATIELCHTIQPFTWSSVHIPITYTLTNTKYPTNSVDTARAIISQANDSGYVRLTLSGAIYASSDTYAYVKVVGSNVDGVYRVLDKYSTTSIVINLAYSTSNNFGGATAQVYYQNYTMNVRVYAGFDTTHDWYVKKPEELLATIQVIPESDNSIFFSINEILKGLIVNENNALLTTLPMNINYFTPYRIEYAESYDRYTVYNEIETFTNTYAEHATTGYAVNAMPEFKSIYEGYLNEYVMSSLSVGKFLTLFTFPVLFLGGCESGDNTFCDTSFILDVVDGNFPLSEFSNKTPASFPWTITSAPTVTLPAFEDNSAIIYHAIRLPPGTYEISHSFTIYGQSVAVAFQVQTFLLDENLNSLQREDSDYNAYDPTDPDYFDTFTGTVFVTITDTAYYIGFRIETYDLASYRFNSYSIDNFVFDNVYLRKTFYLNGDSINSDDDLITFTGPGVYRMQLDGDYCAYDRMDASIIGVRGIYNEETVISEVKTYTIDCNCNRQCIRIAWLNNLGGIDYWSFTAEKSYEVDIKDSSEATKQLMSNWPRSYGAFATTIRRQTMKRTVNRMLVRSQYLTQDQLDAISYIKSSTDVKIVNSRQDMRTVIVDDQSFTKRQDGDKLYSIAFYIEYTDDIPSQRV